MSEPAQPGIPRWLLGVLGFATGIAMGFVMGALATNPASKPSGGSLEIVNKDHSEGVGDNDLDHRPDLPGQFKATGSLPGGEAMRAKVLRMCAEVDNDLDAVNLYGWFNSVRFELYDKYLEDLEARREPSPQSIRKFVQGYVAEASTDGNSMTFRFWGDGK